MRLKARLGYHIDMGSYLEIEVTWWVVRLKVRLDSAEMAVQHFALATIS